MCDAATAGLIIVGAAGSAVQYDAQQDQAKDAAGFANRRYLSTAEAAIESYKLQVGSVFQRQEQDAASTAQLLAENAGQADAARGSIRAGAAAAGFGGGATVDALLRQFGALEATNAETLRTNLRWSNQQQRMVLLGLEAQSQDRINGATAPIVRGPSLAALGLDIASSGLSGYEFYERYRVR